jgi:hypothetical protein
VNVKESGIEKIFEEESKRLVSEKDKENMRNEESDVVMGYALMMLKKSIDSSLLIKMFEYLGGLVTEKKKEGSSLKLRTNCSLSLNLLCFQDGLFYFMFAVFLDFHSSIF